MKITELKGIGEKYAQLLGRLSVYTVEDLVGLYPRDYELYQEPAFISTLSPDYENTNVVIDGVVSKKIDVYHTGKLAVISTFINDENGIAPLILGEGQEFMACIIGAVICGFGLGIVFNANGSTGGTDIIAAIVNKYKDVSLGRMIQICDLIIIGSCYFVFYDLKRVIFGLVTLFIIGYVLDYVVNGARQAVQFFIFSKEYQKIADHINKDTHRGVTVLDGTGWYKKQPVKVLVVLAYKKQSVEIFRLIKSIDPNAFVSQSAVIGVFGEGFNQIKAKVKKDNKQESIILDGQNITEEKA